MHWRSRHVLGLHLAVATAVLLGALTPAEPVRLSSDIVSILQQARERISGMLPFPWREDDNKEKDFNDGDDVTIRAHWALVVAGSAGWGNYRHQADACHAYHVLRKGGFQDRHMVLMVYDDIANHPMNPFPGKIYNRPGGVDVYASLTPDYTGDQVNAKNFLSVLMGEEAAMQGIGSGKVIKSGPRDRVFVFYSDHGSAGVLGMPTGDFLYADQLMTALQEKHKAEGYHEVTMYIEACESGSMFEGLLGNDLGIYVTTAANPFESSWGTYCPGMHPDSGPQFTTCLGDLYSVAWMENSEEMDLTTETLQAQFLLVKNRTSNNYTYVMGSHAMQYGSLNIQAERAGDYMGMDNKGPEPSVTVAGRAGVGVSLSARSSAAAVPHHAVPQREADLVHLRHAASTATGEAKDRAQAELERALHQRQHVDDAVERAAARLFVLPGITEVLMANLGLSYQTVFMSSATPGNGLHPSKEFVHLLTSSPMGRPAPGVPLVDSWDCLRSMVQAWTSKCGRMDDYSMRHTRFFANLCNAGINAQGLQAALRGISCAFEDASVASNHLPSATARAVA